MKPFVDSLRVFISIICVLLLSGCASSSVFRSYTAQGRAIKNAIADQVDLDYTYQSLSKKVHSADKVLYLCERGRLATFMGEPESSNNDYQAAAKALESINMKAEISVSDTLASAASIFVNDNAIPYKSYHYEKTFLHTLQILNYLALGNLEDALVEVRKASNEQRFALKLHEAELANIALEAKRNNIDFGSNFEEMGQSFHSMNTFVGKFKHGFQNGYTFYLSGVLYETAGELQDAKLAYQEALELYPQNIYLQKALSMNKIPAGQGRLIIIYEDGFVPEKKSVTLNVYRSGSMFSVYIPIWGPDFRTYSISMPYYETDSCLPQSLSIYNTANNQLLAQTQLICDVQPLAVKALVEEYPKILVRQILRLISKTLTEELTAKQDKLLGSLVSLYNVVSERADLRSWLTLPNNVQIADIFLPATTYNLNFSGHFIQVPISDSKISILKITRAYDTFYTQILQP